jgi:hypothetical protein
MQMLPPQIELDLIWIMLALAPLAIALLTCKPRAREAGRSNAPNATLRPQAAGPSRPLGRHQ